jgi:hypothetical protein
MWKRRTVSSLDAEKIDRLINYLFRQGISYTYHVFPKLKLLDGDNPSDYKGKNIDSIDASRKEWFYSVFWWQS